MIDFISGIFERNQALYILLDPSLYVFIVSISCIVALTKAINTQRKKK